MNRALFITMGIVVIVLVFVVWLFLFINGAPSNTREIFSDLGIVGQSERSVDTESPENTSTDQLTTLNLTEGQLQQITTSPIAGFGVASTSAGTLLRYIERGTGYIFEVNLDSGVQTQVTPSTIANAVEAFFAPDLTSVVVVAEPSGVRTVSLLELPTDTQTEAARSNLGAEAVNIEYLNNDQVAFTRNSYTETIGYIFDREEKTTTERLRLPIPDAVVLTTEHNNIFTYPKPTSQFAGALYEVIDGTITPASRHLNGLTAFVGGGLGVVSYTNGQNYQSYRLPNYALQSILMLPQKCAAAAAVDSVICGAPNTTPAATYLEDWYKGIISSNDFLWNVHTGTGEAALLVVPTEAVGRQIDVTNMTSDPTADRFFFQNKIDATLWLLSL